MAKWCSFGKILPLWIESWLQEWINESNCVNIFITGKTGTGKTALVNGLVEREVSLGGKSLDPSTKKFVRISANLKIL